MKIVIISIRLYITSLFGMLYLPSIFEVPNASKLLESSRRPPLKREIPNHLPHTGKKVKLSNTKMIISFVLMHMALAILLAIKQRVLIDSFVDKSFTITSHRFYLVFIAKCVISGH